MDRVSITTVFPTYNQGDRLAAFLSDWATVGLSHQSVTATALVVDDGSHAGQAAAQEAALGFYDTQTGMKAFRASRLRPLLPQLLEDHWLLCFMRAGSAPRS